MQGRAGRESESPSQIYAEGELGTLPGRGPTLLGDDIRAPGERRISQMQRSGDFQIRHHSSKRGHTVWSTACLFISSIRPPCTLTLEKAVSSSRKSAGVS